MIGDGDVTNLVSQINIQGQNQAPNDHESFRKAASQNESGDQHSAHNAMSLQASEHNINVRQIKRSLSPRGIIKINNQLTSQR